MPGNLSYMWRRPRRCHRNKACLIRGGQPRDFYIFAYYPLRQATMASSVVLATQLKDRDGSRSWSAVVWCWGDTSTSSQILVMGACTHSPVGPYEPRTQPALKA